MGVLIFMLLLFWFCSGYYPAPWDEIVSWACKIGLILSAISVVCNYLKSKKEYEEKHASEIQRHKERPPVLAVRHNEDVNTPSRKKELIKWNQRNPKYLVEGPCNETPALRTLRLSLLTTEQLATIPFQKRTAIRNRNRHYGGSCSDDCPICGGYMGHYNCIAWYQQMCDKCKQRYGEDLENGWEKTLPEDIDPKYKIMLWRFQQCVLIDLRDGVISEEIAKTELKEVIEVARKEIAEIKRQEAESLARINREKAEQEELKNLSHRLI